MSNAPRIRCAKCDKLVDRVYWEERYDTCDRFIEVECHGQKDSMVLTEKMLIENHRALQDQEGMAFITAALPQKELT